MELNCPYVKGNERCEGWHRGVKDVTKLLEKTFGEHLKVKE